MPATINTTNINSEHDMLSELLLQEAGFIQKFDKIESQAKHMSVEQLAELIHNEYGISISLSLDPQLPPMQAGNASISNERARDGYFYMNLEVGRGVDKDTVVYHVQGMIDNIRHEMQHSHHTDDAGVDLNYHNPHGNPGMSQTMNRVLYTYQYMERPSQVLDLCTALAALDSNPDEFMQVVEGATGYVVHTHEPGMPEQAMHAHTEEAVRGAMGAFITDAKIHKAIDGVGHRYAIVVLGHGTTMVLGKMVHMMMKHSGHPDAKKIQNTMGAFTRQLRKKFPEARAYYRKNSSDRTDAFKTTAGRREELEKAEMSMLDILMAAMAQADHEE